MLVIGAGGHAKEVLDILHKQKRVDSLFFFDDVNTYTFDLLYNQFPIIKHLEEAIKLFQQDNSFILGVGNSVIRYHLAQKFIAMGGKWISIVAESAQVGCYDVFIEKVDIMHNVIITNSVYIGEGSLINRNVNISHDVTIGRYCEISPGVNISGKCKIGNFCNLGTGAIILPKITIGDNVVIGAGAVVTKNIESNSLAVGVPAQVIKKLDPIVL